MGKGQKERDAKAVTATVSSGLPTLLRQSTMLRGSEDLREVALPQPKRSSFWFATVIFVVSFGLVCLSLNA